MYIKRVKKFIIAGVVAGVTLMMLLSVFAVTASAKTNQENETKRAVPFSEVNVDDGFLHNYIKLVICNVIPTAIENVEKPKGGINNIKNCALWHKGETERPDHEGALYVDSDVHKVLESMCMALDTPSGGDKEIEKAQDNIKKKLDEWIPYFQLAPEQNGDYKGYFDSYWSLDPNYVKYSNTRNHELYCQGHFIEAAVAHYRYSKNKEASVDTRLFDVAINSADHIVKTFGTNPGQRKQIPGHEEIELSLIKLAKLCQEIGGEYNAKAENYIKTAAFFLEVRGDYKDRTVDDQQDRRQQVQDHKKVEDQTEAVGHAVRAQYLYTGMCELASIDPEYASKYDNALNSLWNDVKDKKQYITGGIGDRRNNNEAFDEPYVLPNYGSYCETCAGVANMLWNRAMSTLYDGAKYADQIETDLYNNVLGCINFDGNKFYYENRICTNGAFDRSEWFGTACCPPNYTRTILQLGGYVYNTTSNDIFINQYISNNAKFNFGKNNVSINMKSDFPYKGTGEITITPDNDGTFNISLRKPSWSDNYSIKINGKTVTPQEKDGYLVLSGQTWSTSGTKIEYSFDMPLKYVKTDERIETNQGLVAIKHGPIIYCAESCDNEANFDIRHASINQNGEYNFEYVDSLDGKSNPFGVRSVYVLNHSGKYAAFEGIKDITWRFIPYYARCNRTLGAMQVFVLDGEHPFKTHQRAIPSASFTCPRDSVNNINDGLNDSDMRWTSYNDAGYVIPNPYVQYEFNEAVTFKGFRIWWYDDNEGVRLPDDIKFTVYNSQKNTYEEVNINNSNTNVSNDDQYKTYMFPKIYEGDLIKLTILNEKSNHAVGIVQWELIDAEKSIKLEKINITKQPTKTEYVLNEEFDPSGMVVVATYKDESDKESTKEITNYTCSPSKLDKVGQQDITVSYTEEGITKNDTLTVNVKDSITPDSTNNQTNTNDVSSNSPQTGDNLMFIIIPIAVIIIALAIFLIIRLRKNKGHYTKKH